MNIHFVASSSKANCTLVENRGELLVIDAGLTKKAFLRGLAEVFPDVKDHMVSAVRAIVISHHHADHAGHAGEISGALHVPVYASSDCLQAGADKLMRQAEGVRVFTSGEKFVVGAFRLLPVDTYHTPGAVGFRVESFDGAAAIFTDLPGITPAIAEAMKGCGVLALETDYDPGMLETSSYVDDLKYRIRLTHMANDTLAAYFANDFDDKGVHDVALLHLSRQCNLGFIAEGKIRRALARPQIRVRALCDENLPLSIEV